MKLGKSKPSVKFQVQSTEDQLYQSSPTIEIIFLTHKGNATAVLNLRDMLQFTSCDFICNVLGMMATKKLMNTTDLSKSCKTKKKKNPKQKCLSNIIELDSSNE